MSQDTTPAPVSPGLTQWRETVLAHGGDMGRQVVDFDWSATPLGPIESWPSALRTATAVCLTSRFPILLWWGTDYRMIYNDAYRPMLGQSKPRALGVPGRHIWPEIWDVIGPMLDGVLADGEATWSHDQMLSLDRNGFLEECYFTYSYSPLTDEDGVTRGVFCPVTETTASVVGERRLRTLGVLAGDLMEAQGIDEVCSRTMKAMAANTGDIRYAGLFRVGAGQRRSPARLQCADSAGGNVGALKEDETFAGHLLDVAKLGIGRVVEAPAPVLGHSGSTVGEPGHVYITAVPETGVADRTVLVVGLNPQRVWNAEYQAFLELCAGHIGAAMTAARGFAAERDRAEALAQLDAAKTAFFTNVSHELRTPLTLISGPVDQLLESTDEPLPPAQRKQLEMVRRNATRLRRLVDAILDFSRFESGQLAAKREPVDLAELTRELAAAFAPAMKAGGLGFVRRCPTLPRPVYVDRDMWERIVLNLLSNALKYTLSGSVTLELRDAGDEVELTVEDTGVGIPVDQLPKVFERFHRVQDARGRSHEGAGIGLAMVDQFVDLLGGSVSVESAVDVGSTFTVRIPYGEPADRPEGFQAPSRRGKEGFLEEAMAWPTVAPPMLGVVRPGDEAAELAAPRAGIPLVRPGHRPKLLIVEDNRDMGMHLLGLLGATFDVELATDGADAMRKMREARPDIVLSDVMMPSSDGFALLSQVRGDPVLADLPVVLLSARSGEEAAAQGFAAGADDYLVKPFSAADLHARLWANLERASARTRDAAWRTAMVKAMSDAVVLVDDEGTVFEVNNAFELMLGWDQEHAPYRPPYPWRPGPDDEDRAAEMHDRVWEQLREEGFGEWELPIKHRDGRLLWTSVRSSAVPSPEGGSLYVANIRDVTREHKGRERRALAAALSAELAAADSLDAVVSVAVNGFSALFNGDSTVRVVAAPGTHPTIVDSSGPMDEANLSDAVRQGLSTPLEMSDTVEVVKGLLIAPTGAEAECAVWIAFANPRVITPDERIVADMLAEAFGVAVDRAVIEAVHVNRETNLAKAVESHRLVGQAIGILIERHRLSPAQAFEELKKVSQRRNIKLHEIARRVIETGQEPDDTA